LASTDQDLVNQLDRLGRSVQRKGANVGLLLAVLLLIILFFVLGFWAVKFLLWIAIILAILWVIGFFVRGAEGARWYRW
jgi:predicted RND superfamily exporter protein